MTEEVPDISAEDHYQVLLEAAQVRITESLSQDQGPGNWYRNLEKLAAVEQVALEAVRQMESSQVIQMMTFIMQHHEYGILRLINDTETNNFVFELGVDRPGWHARLFLDLRAAIAIDLCRLDNFPQEMFHHTGAWYLILGPR